MASVVPYWGWVTLVFGGIVAVSVGVVVGLVKTWEMREKRDGLR